jgi:hypothetical protein
MTFIPDPDVVCRATAAVLKSHAEALDRLGDRQSLTLSRDEVLRLRINLERSQVFLSWMADQIEGGRE